MTQSYAKILYTKGKLIKQSYSKNLYYTSEAISHWRRTVSRINNIHLTVWLTGLREKHWNQKDTYFRMVNTPHIIKYSETALSNSYINYFWAIQNSSVVIEKLRLRNIQGSQVSYFDFSSIYTLLLHDLIKAKVLSLFNKCFNRESKTYLCTSDKAGFF